MAIVDPTRLCRNTSCLGSRTVYWSNRLRSLRNADVPAVLGVSRSVSLEALPCVTGTGSV